MDVERAAAVIRDQFPELGARTVSKLGEGCDSVAFDVDPAWVFRFPKRADVEAQIAIESRVLQILGERSPIPLPVYQFHGRPSALFPRGFGGYAKLPGRPANSVEASAAPLDRWAPDIARFLSWLHEFPVHEIEGVAVPRLDTAAFLDEVRADALDGFGHLARVTTDAPLERWHACLLDAPGVPAASATSPVLLHADFAAEHVLCDEAAERITGIIDWSEVAVGDRTVDLAGLFHWGGPPFAEAVLSRYTGPVDAATVQCARYLAVCRAVMDVAFGLDSGRPEYVAAGVRALQMCV